MDTMKHELLNKFQAIIDDKLSKYRDSVKQLRKNAN